MPFSSRFIEPTSLTQDLPTDTDPECVNFELENIAVTNLMRQLASLLRHADDIFCDLADECYRACNRTEKIHERITSIKQTVSMLDYNTVQIPVGDLNQFSAQEQRHDEFVASHGYTSYLFTPDQRPRCVKDQYDAAVLNPVTVISNCDTIRKDGYRGSMLFKIWPVSKTDLPISPGLERKNFPFINYDKDYKILNIKNTSSLHDETTGDICEPEAVNDAETCKEEGVVKIDTTGAGFERMCSFRQSLRKYEYEPISTRDRKKRRRKTVSGVPEEIWKDICEFEQSHDNKMAPCRITDKVKSYSFDDLDSPANKNEDTEMIEYLNKVEDRIEEREMYEQSMKESRFLRLITCRRSRSVPKSSKTIAPRSNSEPRTTLKPANKRESRVTNSNSQSCASVNSLASSVRTSRSSIRQNLGAKLRSALSTSLNRLHVRERPKSLDLERICVDVHASQPEPSPSNPEITSRSPDCPVFPNPAAGLHSGPIGKGSFYHFDSNTLPKIQAKKYNFPWDTLPKDWTTSVRLREISKRKLISERQSSSGNWSGESSNRQSMDSANGHAVVTKQKSEATDSGRDSPSVTFGVLTSDTAAEYGDNFSTVTESNRSEGESSVYDLKSEFSKLDTETWLRKLAIRTADNEGASSSSSETLASFPKTTRRGIAALEASVFAGDKQKQHRRDLVSVSDDQLSLYSQDNDGFYTSFHNDSGLRRSRDYLIDEDDVSTPTNELSITQSLQSMKSTATIDTVICNLDLADKRAPPAPPSRTSSSRNGIDRSISVHSSGSDCSAMFLLSEPSVLFPASKDLLDFSFSESDQDDIYLRLHEKTTGAAARWYPSLCEVSPSETDEGSIKDFVFNTDHGMFIDDEFSLDFEKNIADVSLVHDASSLLDFSITDKYFPTDYHVLPQNVTGPNVSGTNSSWPRSSRKSATVTSNHTSTIKKADLSQATKPASIPPIVNMYDPGTPPMIKSTLPVENSIVTYDDSSIKLPTENSFNDEKFEPRYKVSLEISDAEEDTKQDKIIGLPEKYLPIPIVRPGVRTRNVDSPSTVNTNKSEFQVTEDKPKTYYRPSFDASSFLKRENHDTVSGDMTQFGSLDSSMDKHMSSSMMDSGIYCFSELSSPSVNLTTERVCPTSSHEASSVWKPEQKVWNAKQTNSQESLHTPSSVRMSNSLDTTKTTFSSFASLNPAADVSTPLQRIPNEAVIASRDSAVSHPTTASVGVIVPIKTHATGKSRDLPQEKTSMQSSSDMNASYATDKKLPNTTDPKPRYTSDQILTPSYTMMARIHANKANAPDMSSRTNSYRNAVSLQRIPQTQSNGKPPNIISNGKTPHSNLDGKTPHVTSNGKTPQSNLDGKTTQTCFRPTSLIGNKLNLSKALHQAGTSRSGSYRVACDEITNIEANKKAGKQPVSLLNQRFQTPSMVQDVSPRTESYRTAVFGNKTGDCRYLDTLQERNKSYRVALHENAMLRVNNKTQGLVYRGVSSVTLPVHKADDKNKIKINKSQGDVKSVDDKSKIKLSRSKISDSSMSNDDIDHVTDMTSHIGRSDKTSSTYICFDPIDELGEDNSSDISRNGSLTSVMTVQNNASDLRHAGKKHGNRASRSKLGKTGEERSFHIIQPTRESIARPAATKAYNAYPVHAEIETGV